MRWTYSLSCLTSLETSRSYPGVCGLELELGLLILLDEVLLILLGVLVPTLLLMDGC